jgi:hypothetical protein
MATSINSTSGVMPAAATTTENTSVAASIAIGKAKKASTRKRAGANVMAMMLAQMVSFFEVPNNSVRRAASDLARNPPNHKLRQQYNSLLDQLLAGKDRKQLPEMIHALHLVLGEVATIKYNATPEQNARPYIDAYFREASREDLLRAMQRLDVLAGAESLFETMNETNRQDVKGLIAELKCSAMGELARQTICEPLRMLAGRLSESELNASGIGKALFTLADAVYDAHNDGVPLVPYVQSGLSNIPPGTTLVLSAVLSPKVPPHARNARDLLERVVQETPKDTPAAAAFGYVLTDIIHDGVRAHILSYLDGLVPEMARKLDNAVQPGIRTAEVGNLVRADIRRKLEGIGWVYLNSIPDGDSDWAREDEAIEAETERQFVRALEQARHRNAQEFLKRADTELLVAMYRHRHFWTDEQRRKLGDAFDDACDARLASMRDDVEHARVRVRKVLPENRRIATAHELVNLGDALVTLERFALQTGAPLNLDSDPAIDAAIRDAAASLRLPGEPGDALGHLSLRGLDDAAFADLRHSGESLASRGLVMDPIAAAAEVSRRTARFDAALHMRLEQFSELVRDPGLAPVSFTSMVAELAQADIARREIQAAFTGGDADPTRTAASSELISGIAAILSRGDGKAQVQWKEVRRHVAGLLALLGQTRSAIDAGTASNAPAAHGVSPYAMLDSAIAILRAMEGHRDIDAASRPYAVAAQPVPSSLAAVEA